MSWRASRAGQADRSRAKLMRHKIKLEDEDVNFSSKGRASKGFSSTINFLDEGKVPCYPHSPHPPQSSPPRPPDHLHLPYPISHPSTYPFLTPSLATTSQLSTDPALPTSPLRQAKPQCPRERKIFAVLVEPTSDLRRLTIQ
jgi:hypothetical protein